jgi:hypothetical protein
VYAGDWLRDGHTGFALRATLLTSNDDFQSHDGQWVIRQNAATLFIPASGEAIDHDRVAACDWGAYRRARMGASAPQHMPPVSLDGPSVFEKLDWLYLDGPSVFEKLDWL